jgi:hypothetical protein
MINWSDSSNLTPACSSLYHTRSFWNTTYWVSLILVLIRSAHQDCLLCTSESISKSRALISIPKIVCPHGFIKTWKLHEFILTLLWCSTAWFWKILMPLKKNRWLKCGHRPKLRFCFIFKLVRLYMWFQSMYWKMESWDLENRTLNGHGDVVVHLSYTFSYGWLKLSGQISSGSTLLGQAGTSPSY